MTTTIATERNPENSTRYNQVFLSILPRFRRWAKLRMKHERAGHSLDSGDLVGLVWARLRSNSATIVGSTHLFRMAKRTVGRILVDHHRQRHSERRGGDRHHMPLDIIPDPRHEQVSEVGEALEQLKKSDERPAVIFKLRSEGYSVKEISQKLRVSKSCVEKDYFYARAWLLVKLRGPEALK